MSPSENLIDAGRRLARDLKDLREDRNIDVEVLLKAIRLPADILDNFDDAALVDHPSFNHVYIRSIVTSYAKVLGIDAEIARGALEEVLTGNYDGVLRRKYLTDSESNLADSFVAVTEPSVELEEPADAESSAELEEPADAESSAEPETIGAGNRDDSKENADNTSTAQSAAVADPAIGLEQTDDRQAASHQKVESDIPVRSSVVSPPRRWIYISGLAIAGMLSIWFGLRVISPAGPAEIPPTPETVAPMVKTEKPPPELISLPDSMEFSVIAAFDDVDPIRVTRDKWARRPYWIELGDTLRFRAADYIVFESDIEGARIEIEGFFLSDSLVSREGRFEMTRSRTQRWLDSLIVRRDRVQ